VTHSHPAPRRLALVPREGPGQAPAAVAAGPLTLDSAFRQYSSYVARIGARILGRDDDEIDDLVQDVFTRAAAGLKRMTEAAEVRGWLGTVTVRVAVRRLRLRRVRSFIRLHSGVLPGAAEPISPFASPEQRATILGVYQILERLPARQRAAWVLRHVEGERLDEVARHCGCSLATAKRLIARAEEWIERNTRDATR
jgi:RNA polymerase sigma-70 factor, ECF subfamily